MQVLSVHHWPANVGERTVWTRRIIYSRNTKPRTIACVYQLIDNCYFLCGSQYSYHYRGRKNSIPIIEWNFFLPVEYLKTCPERIRLLLLAVAIYRTAVKDVCRATSVSSTYPSSMSYIWHPIKMLRDSKKQENIVHSKKRKHSSENLCRHNTHHKNTRQRK